MAIVCTLYTLHTFHSCFSWNWNLVKSQNIAEKSKPCTMYFPLSNCHKNPDMCWKYIEFLLTENVHNVQAYIKHCVHIGQNIALCWNSNFSKIQFQLYLRWSCCDMKSTKLMNILMQPITSLRLSRSRQKTGSRKWVIFGDYFHSCCDSSRGNEVFQAWDKMLTVKNPSLLSFLQY